MHTWTVATRQRVFEEFYQLTAREVMDDTFARTAFLPPHCAISTALDALVTADRWRSARESFKAPWPTW